MLKYCNPTKIGKISVILIQKMSNSGIFVQEKGEVECPQGKKCAPLHVTNMRSVRISATAETMTGGEHFRHPGGGGSRA